jgi:small nuclear ribonucleoprotein (snRNP)-like protein
MNPNPEPEIDSKIRRLFRFVGQDVEVATKYGTIYIGKLIAFDHHQNVLLGGCRVIRRKMPFVETSATTTSGTTAAIEGAVIEGPSSSSSAGQEPNPVEKSPPAAPPSPATSSEPVTIKSWLWMQTADQELIRQT